VIVRYTANIDRKGGYMVKTFNILLKSINDVKDFVNIANRYEFDVDLTSGRYVVDAKSIMGIFSLDLSKAIKVEVQSDTTGEFYKEVKVFEV
jgi:hypothetical protein